jgi:hypothetical protein
LQKYNKVPNFKTFLSTLETKLAKLPFLKKFPFQNLENKTLVILGDVFCTSKFIPNFDLKNMISTYAKDFSWKKGPKFTIFLKKEVPNCHIFNGKFH